MRRLILLRHSKTVPSVPAGDHARHLSPRGVADAAEAARRLTRHATPDFALVSDARRTRETFERMVEALGAPIAHRFEPALYGAAAADILTLIAGAPDTVETLMVISHNPGIGDLARRLAQGGSSPERVALDAHFPTSAFAIIGLASPDWAGAGKGGALELFATRHDG